MPKFDGTGPMGMGPRTGRGFGPCGFGLGLRRMFGRGRGMGRYFGWNQPQTPKDQLAALNGEILWLESTSNSKRSTSRS
jgi:hypothetical protein